MKEFSLAKTALIVISFHLVVILWMVFANESTVTFKPRERLTIQTVSFSTKEEPIAMASQPPALPVKKETPKPPVETPPPPPPEPPIPPKPKPPTKTPKVAAKPKKPEPQKKQPVAAAVDPRKKELLAQAQESIAKIQQNRATFKAESTDSKGRADNEAAGYHDELVARLQMMLRLPERGDVRIKLTLSKTGKVVKMEILGADSNVNRKYVEKSLPPIQFPPFGKELGNAAESSFNITLSSEI